MKATWQGEVGPQKSILGWITRHASSSLKPGSRDVTVTQPLNTNGSVVPISLALSSHSGKSGPSNLPNRNPRKNSPGVRFRL